MKKVLSLLLLVIILLNFSACNASTNETTSPKNIYIGSESFTKDEFRDMLNNNEYKFRNEYIGKSVTVTGKITKIEGSYKSTNLNHFFEAVVTVDGLWCFEVSEDNPILQNADVGDSVTATGTISTSLIWQVYCYGNAKITKN